MPEVKIEELNEIIYGQDSNLMILEDDNDTKKITLKNFKKTLIDDQNPDDNSFYSSNKINTLYTLTNIELQKKALQIQLDSLETRFDDVIHNSESELNQIRNQYTESITSLWAAIDKATTKEELERLNTEVNELIAYITGNATYNSEDAIAMEIIDARNGNATLGLRLDEDDEFNVARFIKKPRERGESGNPIKIDGTNIVDISVECKDNPNAKISINIESGNIINYNVFKSSPNGGEDPAQENSFIVYKDFGFVYDNSNLKKEEETPEEPGTDPDPIDPIPPDSNPDDEDNTDDDCCCTVVSYEDLYKELKRIWDGTSNTPDDQDPNNPIDPDDGSGEEVPPSTTECPCMDECEEVHNTINSTIDSIEEKIASIEATQEEILKRLDSSEEGGEGEGTEGECDPACQKAHEELQANIDEVSKSLEEAKKEHDNIYEQIQTQQSRVNSLNTKVDNVNATQEDIMHNITLLEDRDSNIIQTQENMQKDIEENEEKIASVEADLAQQITDLVTKLNEIQEIQNNIIKKIMGEENTLIDEVLKEDVVREARFQFKIDKNTVPAGTYYLYFNLDSNLPAETKVKVEPGIDGTKYGKASGIITTTLNEFTSGIKFTAEDDFDTLFITIYNIIGIEKKNFSMTYIVMSSREKLYQQNEKITLSSYLYHRRNFYSVTPENNTIEDVKITDSIITAYPEDAIITVSYYVDIDMQKFYDQVTQAIDYIKSSGKDPEIIDARDGEVTLHKRIVRDISSLENKFVKKTEVISDAVSSIKIKDKRYIDIEVDMHDVDEDKVIISSDNLLDIAQNTSSDEYLTYTSTGLVYNNKSLNINYDALQIDGSGTVSISDEKPITEIVIPLHLGTTLDAGEYFFYSDLAVNDITDKETLSICIECGVNGEKTDKAINKFIRSYDSWNGNIAISCVDNFDTIFITYTTDTDLLKTELEYNNIMLTNNALSSNSEQVIPYISYYHREYTLNTEENKFSIENVYVNNCTVSLVSRRPSMIVRYYDDVDGNELTEIVQTLQEKVLETREYCGIIKNTGNYHLLTDMINVNEFAASLDYPKNTKYKRNNIFSARLSLNGTNEPARIVKYISEDIPSILESVSLVFYLDRKLIDTFPINNTIRIILSSDSYANYNPTNYLDYTIPREGLVNGWNVIKVPMSKFNVNGNPDTKNLNDFIFEVQQSEDANNMNIWFNALIFNQNIKPTVVLAFSGLYDTTTSYLLPYMASKELPCTIMINGSRDTSATEISDIIEHRLINNVDIGAYGYHTKRYISSKDEYEVHDKDELTQDNNAKYQYAGLSAATTWLRDNYVYNPVSYSAPYGNLRPVTVSLLDEIGYKMAISKSTGYIAFFSDKELEVPSFSFDTDSTFDDVKDVIDNAILTNQSVVLSTHEVSEFGDEQSMRMATFEKVVEYLLELVNEEKIEVMSMKQFVETCNN